MVGLSEIKKLNNQKVRRQFEINQDLNFGSEEDKEGRARCERRKKGKGGLKIKGQRMRSYQIMLKYQAVLKSGGLYITILICG